MILNASELRDMFKVQLLDDDERLLTLIIAAEDEAKRRCGTVLEAADLTEYHDGDGTSDLLLRNFPVNSIASVRDDVNREFGTETEIPAADRVFESFGKLALDGRVFGRGKQNVKVVYNAGLTEIPYDLKVAVGSIAFANYLEQNASINMVEGQEFIYRPGKLRKAAADILDRYVKVV